jgi:hypothetical protein
MCETLHTSIEKSAISYPTFSGFRRQLSPFSGFNAYISALQDGQRMTPGEILKLSGKSPSMETIKDILRLSED